MNNTVGGGEILDKLGGSGVERLYNDSLLQYTWLPVIRAIIVVLLLCLMVLAILKIFGLRTPFTGRGIIYEIDYVKKVRKHDATILRVNKFLKACVKLVDNTPLALGKSVTEYWEYNVERANIKVPTGFRQMKAKEFHALIQLGAVLVILVSLVIMIAVNTVVGWVSIITTVVLAGYVPMMLVRHIVKEKDDEIKDNFINLYLMIHYDLCESSSTPLASTLKSYHKTTTSNEMMRFVDSCVYYIELYGEFEATRYIAKDYREIPEVGKLMRFIRQSQSGGEVRAELQGFKSELINNERFAIEKRKARFIARAQVSFYILMPVLFQAIISAMAIYFPELGMLKSLMG